MPSPVPFWIALGVASLLQLSAAAKAPARTPTKEDRARFAWFDQLDLEKYTKLPLVRVRLGFADYSGKPRVRRVGELWGFLLWDKGDEFRVLCSDLTAMTLKHGGQSPADDDYAGWRKTTISREAALLVKVALADETKASTFDSTQQYYERLVPAAQLFVLARYAAAQGQTTVAAKLLRSVPRAYAARSMGADVERSLQTDFGMLLNWLTTLSTADPAMNRQQLAARFRRIGLTCPGYYWRSESDAMADSLEAMAKEDAMHTRYSDEAFRQLPVDEQARELVFQLRDESDPSEPSWQTGWPFEPRPSNHASKRLVELGPPAVPALLAALTDRRPSRVAFIFNRFGGAAYTQEIRRLAVDALEEIAGIKFFRLREGPQLPEEESWRLAIEVAAGWWKATQDGKEAPWLEPYLVRHVDACSDALASRYPARFQEMLEKATWQEHVKLVGSLWKLKTPETEWILWEELSHGRDFEDRATAAAALRRRGKPEALAAMLAEWRAPAKEPAGTAREKSDRPSAPLAVLGFLAATDSVEAHQALMERWPRLSTDTRGTIVNYWRYFLQRTEGDEKEPGSVTYLSDVASPPTRAAVKGLLMQALNDDAVYVENNENYAANNLTIGEDAAETLTDLWPNEFHFVLKSQPKQRGAQMAKVRLEAQKVTAGARQPKVEAAPASDASRP